MGLGFLVVWSCFTRSQWSWAVKNSAMNSLRCSSRWAIVSELFTLESLSASSRSWLYVLWSVEDKVLPKFLYKEWALWASMKTVLLRIWSLHSTQCGTNSCISTESRMVVDTSYLVLLILHLRVCLGFKEAASYILNGITIGGAMVMLFLLVVC